MQSRLVLCKILLSGTVGFLPSSLCAQAGGSKYKLYDIGDSINSYLYYVQEQVVNGKTQHRWAPSKNQAEENWGIALEHHSLVMAEEVEGSDGKYYLKIPYGGRPEGKESAGKEVPYFLIPQLSTMQKIVDGKITEPNYQPAYPGEKKTGAILAEREDNIVYPNLSYQKRLPLTQNPQDYSNECASGKKDSKCLSGPDSQEKLKVVDTAILMTERPGSKKKYMELYYNVEYTKKACNENGGAKSKCKDIAVRAWTPSANVIDFKRDPADLGNTVPARTKKLLKKIDEKLKAQPKADCDLKKVLLNQWPEDISLMLKESEKMPVDPADLGVCLGSDHIRKMNDSDNQVQQKYQPLIEAANKEKDYNTVLKLEHQKNKERIHELGNTWAKKETPFDAYIREHWDKKDSGGGRAKNSANKAQMLSIDSLARTLYGELREAECSGDTSSYYKEVARVMMNRAALVKKRGGRVEKFVSEESLAELGDPAKAGLFEILPHVLSSPAQISSWNTNDDNLRNNLCPKPQNPAETTAWELAVAVASEAVLKTKNFLEETNNLSSALFYASKIRPYWEDHKEFSKYGPVNIKLNIADSDDKSTKVYNQTVYNPRCVKLYRNENYTEDIKQIRSSPNKYYSEVIFRILNVM